MIPDISNFDDPTFDAQCFKNAGVTAVILGCQDPFKAERQGDALIAVGIPIISTYGFDYFGVLDAPGDIIDAISLAKKYNVREARRKLGIVNVADVYIDAEIDGYAGVDQYERAAEVAYDISLIEGADLIAGIYTGSWFWEPNLGNTDQFKKYSLWHSAYPNDGHQISTVNYGGWTKVGIHQYTSNGNFCGRVERDLNYIIDQTGDTEEMGMTAEETQKMNDTIADLQQVRNQLWGTLDVEGNLQAPDRDNAHPYVTDEDGNVVTFTSFYKAFSNLKNAHDSAEIGDGTYKITKVK